MPWGGGSYGALYKRGGRLPTGMKGGGSPPPLPPPPSPIYSPAPIGRSGEMSAAIPPGGMSTEEAIAEAAPFFKYYGDSGGVPSWAKSQIGRMTTPQFRCRHFYRSSWEIPHSVETWPISFLSLF